jgi:acyl transferase domain-containing protein
MSEELDNCDVAIIGMAGRFPRAANLEEFWANLKEGVEGIAFFSDEDLEVVMDPDDLRNPNLIKAKGVLDDVDLFDAPFFNISVREAQIMDPQQRLFLEAAWNAIESAGYDVSTYPGQIAVYAGVNTNTYLLSRLEQLGLWSAADYFTLSLANEKDHLATRVSYKLNLRGESIAVQSSCSTSLVAVHLACQSLLSGQCDMALAGGVSIRVPQKAGYIYQEGMIMSPDGHCRAFDERAQGTVPGHGLGIVVLKVLADAVRDGDNVRAIIKGSAINNDGHLKMGYTAPSVEGQTDVIAKALAIAGVDAETISYVEAHGTATPLGDPIEVEALTRAFRQQTQRSGFCALGAVKSNIGHLDNAAGVAGLIKTVLALEHKQIPPTLHFEKPNPMIGFERTPFMPIPILKDWDTDGFPRRAGVSSFGIGGTNAHVILEEAGESAPASLSRRQHEIITLSAKTDSALSNMAEALAQVLMDQPTLALADVAYTRSVGRQVFPHKRFVVASSIDEAVAGLRAPETPVRRRQLTPPSPPIVFMFPGQGTQTVGMGRGLLDTQPDFAKPFAECCALLKEQHKLDLRSLLYPDAERAEDSAKLISQPQFALPALFAVGYSLSRLWISWGIRPSAMIGHSFGEYVAACLAEVLSLPDAFTLVVSRGRLMNQLPPGAMIVVRLSAAELQSYLSEELAISAVNSPGICTASGPVDQIAKLQGRLAERSVACRRLEVPFAYHSSMVDSILPEFEAVVAGLTRKPPAIPYISNVTGAWITPEEVLSNRYWSEQMRQTVRFAHGLETLVRDHSAFVEIGSGQTLVPLLKPLEKDRELLVLASLSHSSLVSDEAAILKSLGRLWQAEHKVDWSGFFRGERRRRLALPTYPFDLQRYWIEAPGHKAFHAAAEAVTVPEAGTAASAGTIAPPNNQVSPLRSALLSEYVAPRNEIEVSLARIWSDVLGQGQIGAEDNFFDLGGDSLLATQVYARVKQVFAIDVSLQQMFEHQRLSDLSQAIQAALQNEGVGPNGEHSGQDEVYYCAFESDINDERLTVFLTEAEFQRNGLPPNAQNFRLI